MNIMPSLKLIIVSVVFALGGMTGMSVMLMGYEVASFFAIIPFQFVGVLLHTKWYEEK